MPTARHQESASAVTARASQAYLPPEWAPQSGVMLTWPHAQTDWVSYLKQVEAVYVDLTREISARENVLIVCRDVDHRAVIRQRLCAGGVNEEHTAFCIAPSNDTWTRDHGPITVTAGVRPRLLDFRFNGWGGRYPCALDDAMTAGLHAAGAFGNIACEQIDMVLEGGSIEVDGNGTLLTTARCLLSPNRNPTLDQQQIECRLAQLLGVERILWLQHGSVPGDDTDGHVDSLARFCDEATIAYSACDDVNDPHYEDLRALEHQLACLRTRRGEPYRLIALPWPMPIHGEDGRRLPANYANFVIINDAVLLPAYDDPADEVARQRLAECFVDRELVCIDSRPLLQQYGSLHCATMQLPAGVLD
ncbi:MAG: agmatine/peptidylarginine deiminase [Acidiferrobacterales bacterium]